METHDVPHDVTTRNNPNIIQQITSGLMGFNIAHRTLYLYIVCNQAILGDALN